ncbi:MAG: U32 family peptidase [Clostridia bacterium]|nr:U32 family peptidase [Clostridia bacterium]
MKNNKIELLAPAGDIEKLKTAIHFGADAVYFAGKNYGLRAFGTNFEDFSIEEAMNLLHSNGKKGYVTINVYARHNDFDGLKEYVQTLVDAKVDAVIVSDLGIFSYIKENFPKLPIHVSTQANTTNAYAAKMWKKLGAERVVLARELNIDEIKNISSNNPDLELEAFIHGAMCISYSGRCLLSNYLTNRDSNHGECVQACRWKYSVTEETRPDEHFDLMEDNRGTYIFNSKDLCLIDYIDKISDAGVVSYKVEGRMKSPYYVATIINAYRRAISHLEYCRANNIEYKTPETLKTELFKASHRKYTTGFMFSDGKPTQNYESAVQEQDSKFMAIVQEVQKGKILVEQRNKFSTGDELEILSPADIFGKVLKVTKMEDEKGNPITEAKMVQQKIWIYTDLEFQVGDILRK